MTNLDDITIAEYLDDKGIKYIERNGELLVECIYNECDKDIKGSELPHLYFNNESGDKNGLHKCHKCGQTGNKVTLAQFLGDIKPKSKYKYTAGKSGKSKKTSTPAPKKPEIPKAVITEAEVETYHRNLPERIRTYLHDRGINDGLISMYKLGWAELNGLGHITIPIFGKDKKPLFFKYRKDPEDTNKSIERYRCSIGAQASIYGYDSLADNPEQIVICEGELDRLL